MYDRPDTAPALTVSELNHSAKTLLESHFDFVRVEGEIGNFTAASSGHWYFNLKDANAQVRCAMFRNANSQVKLRPTGGDHVRIRARVSLYEARGEYQLIVQHLEPAGDGALQLAFEQLKRRLEAEGLFALERKQTVTRAARRVGVITSAAGAALHDILSVLARRSPMTEVFLYPVPVQGKEAPPAIVSALKQANTLHRNGTCPLDVLIVGRGGGSLEDLWAFNEEVVARAIADSELPVVSAVGHEVDFSIADFVADERAATPSAAAERVSIDQREWIQTLDRAEQALKTAIRRTVFRERERLNHLKARLRHPGLALANQRTDLERARRALQRSMAQKIDRERNTVSALEARLKAQHPSRMLSQLRADLPRQQHRLKRAIERKLVSARQSLEQQRRLLHSLGPENTLSRGYAIVETDDHHILRDATGVTVGTAITVRLARGRLGATVTRTDSTASKESTED